jgi:hypothetical protein
MKQLPIGIQTFEKIITGNHVYADKTKLIYNLVKTEKAFFLSRPRRFGKSLLLSTFEAIFQGPQDPDGPPQGLFKDLWIGRSDYDFTQTNPVITLDMSSVNSSSSEKLEHSILKKLKSINRTNKLRLDINDIAADVSDIIQILSKNNQNKKVVVLIDEYDAPVSDHIGNITLAQETLDVLKSFYSGFKKTDQYLRFVSVTGVTKYAFMGLAAGFNQLDDLTINDDYADICGFTHDDLDSCFGEYLPIVLEKMNKIGNMPKKASEIDLKNKILNWYDGYNWGGKTNVLNPWSIMKFFQQVFFPIFGLAQLPRPLF